MVLNVAIFAGSKKGDNEEYERQAKSLGNLIAQNNWNVFCGDGEGLADVVINTIKNDYRTRSRTVNFVTPEKLHVQTLGTPVLVKDVLEQQSWLNKADVYITLPGSGMTLSEIFSAMAEIFKTKSKKYLAILDTNKFYEKLFDFFKSIKDFGFSNIEQPDCLKRFDKPEDLINFVKNLS